MMMRKKNKITLQMVLAALFTIHYSLFTSTSCANPSPEQQAALAAEGYYRHLVAGEYEKFLEGRVGADSLPDSYREQLLTGYKQFMAQQQRVHQGIVSVSLCRQKLKEGDHDSGLPVTVDTLAGYTSVFLLLCYGDSTQEEIVVPMVEHNGRWRMR